MGGRKVEAKKVDLCFCPYSLSQICTGSYLPQNIFCCLEVSIKPFIKCRGRLGIGDEDFFLSLNDST